MVKLNIFAGGNAAIIASYLFDTDSSNSLTLLRQNPSGQKPSWIEKSLFNASVLFAVNEVENGTIQSFAIHENGTLSDAISHSDTNGSSPAHVFAGPNGLVSVTNFGGGNGTIFDTDSTGQFDTSTAAGIDYNPTGMTGKQSNPHQTIPYNDELLVPDRGSDVIWRVSATNKSITGGILHRNGSGPRHAAIYKDILVTLHEFSNTLTSERINPNSSTYLNTTTIIISELSIVPNDNTTGFLAAEVLIPAPNSKFNTTLVYASNRFNGTTDEGDAIAIFSLQENGTLTFVKHFFTGLNQVRGMQFGGPDDMYLVAGGLVGSAGVKVFERTGNGEDFKELAHNTELQGLTSFVWM